MVSRVSWCVRFIVLCLVCANLAGCGSRQPEAAAPPSHDHTAEHAEAAHDHDRPASFAAGVASLKEHHDRIKAAFQADQPPDVDESLHRVGDILEALPSLAKRAGLTDDQLEKAGQTIDAMFKAYGTIDAAVHQGEQPDYASVSAALDQNMTALDRMAAGRAQAQAAEEQTLRLAFITCCKDAPFFEPVKKGMHDAATKMGVSCSWMGVEGVDMPAQAKLVTEAVEQGFDGIALNLVDPEAFDGVVKQALEKGVPVVGFNTDDHATANQRLSCVNQRLYDAGRALARFASPHIPAGSHVLMTMHDEGVSSLEDRLRGLQDELKDKNVRATVRISGIDAVQGAEVIRKALEENPDIRFVLCTGQADTEAAGRAIDKYFAGKGYGTAGFDLSPTTLQLVKKGIILGTVDQQPYIQGFYPVVQLTFYLRYGITPSDIDAGASIITQDNVDQAMELTKLKYR